MLVCASLFPRSLQDTSENGHHDPQDGMVKAGRKDPRTVRTPLHFLEGSRQVFGTGAGTDADTLGDETSNPLRQETGPEEDLKGL